MILKFYLEHPYTRSQYLWLLSPTLGNQEANGYFCNLAPQPKGGGLIREAFFVNASHPWEHFGQIAGTKARVEHFVDQVPCVFTRLR